MDVVCGVDVGTSGAKALAVDRAGHVLARAERAFDHPPTQPAPGYAEQDADQWWIAARDCLKALAAALPGGASRKPRPSRNPRLHCVSRDVRRKPRAP